jgi:4-diphosphocytidyl-2-C-methyl-D-erythritol kinase
VTPPADMTRAVEAPAKVNLFLRVLGRRDDGFHDLQTLVAPISLADRVQVHADADASFRTLALSLVVTGGPDLTRGIPRDESNLALKAAVALAERASVRGFADVTLEKRVPPAAGLGGGSADAAAVLRILNELWGCRLQPEELREVGVAVGSDVPALMMGGPVLARGRGERVESVSARSLALVLVTFPFPVATPDAFGWWDEDGSTGPEGEEILQAAGPDGDDASLARLLFNDLEGPVIRRHPDIGRAKDLLLEAGARGVVMSGSGPTVVGVLPESSGRLPDSAARSIEGLGARSPLYVRSGSSIRDGEPRASPTVTRTVGKGNNPGIPSRKE